MAGTDSDLGDTEALVRFAGRLKSGDLPQDVRRECVRALINAAGCMIAGSRHELTIRAHRTLAEFSGSPAASLLGTCERVDVLTAAHLNALAGAAYSFDDTYSHAMLHPAGPIIAGLMALSERFTISGDEFLTALAVGLETSCRLTKMLAHPPATPEMAWSQTGIVSGVGASLAAAKVLRLDNAATAHAVGIAASESSGSRLTHGSMAASLLFAKAAQSGVRAAFLGANGFTGPADAVEGRYGLATLFTKSPHLPALTEGLGVEFELLRNTYKPFPCGLVIHPALDGILRLRRSIQFEGRDVFRIDLEVCPTAITFGFDPDPADELKAKVSLQHWVAAAAHTGRAGLEEGGIEVIRNPEVRRLRHIIHVVPDDRLAPEAARVRVTLANGAVHELSVEHCLGSPQQPMSDDDLDTKFLQLSEPVIGPERARNASLAFWNVTAAADVGELVKSLTPS